MDASATVAQKHERESDSDNYSRISEMTPAAYRELDLLADARTFLPLFLKAWKNVVGEDLSEIVKWKMKGMDFEGPAIELKMYEFLNNGFKIRLCLVAGSIAGFCIYSKVFENVIALRFVYFVKVARQFGFARELILSIEGVEAAIFQTMNAVPPAEMLQMLGGRSRLLSKHDKVNTWFMEREG